MGEEERPVISVCFINLVLWSVGSGLPQCLAVPPPRIVCMVAVGTKHHPYDSSALPHSTTNITVSTESTKILQMTLSYTVSYQERIENARTYGRGVKPKYITKWLWTP